MFGDAAGADEDTGLSFIGLRPLLRDLRASMNARTFHRQHKPLPAAWTGSGTIGSSNLPRFVREWR